MADLLPVISPPTLAVPTCCGISAVAPPPAEVTTRFHFSLNVANIEKSVDFYRKLFGVEPAKHHPDYAKFEVEQPPLVFSLVPNAPGAHGALSHLGFPVGSTEEVQAAATRLAAAGLQVSCQDRTVCGYARQDKVWVSDPDQNYWEIYVVHEDVDPETVRSGYDGEAPKSHSAADAPAAERRAIYEHRVIEPRPDWSVIEDGSADEVRLTGTFNSALPDDERMYLLKEALRILKAGGQLNVHGLVASQPIGSVLPNLPGVASLVKRVMAESEPLAELVAAGFAGVRVSKLAASPVFQAGPIEMREIKIAAFKAVGALLAQGSTAPRVVVYKGPFATATDDTGKTYRRGERTTVTPGQEELLGRSTAAANFLFVEQEAGCGTPCG